MRRSILAPAFTLAAPALALTVRVPADQPTIQAGIDAADVGDTVLVAPGSYTGDGNRELRFNGKDLVLRSEAGPDTTVISCAGGDYVGFRLYDGESRKAIIEGFTICDGKGSYEGAGGMQIANASPTIVDCIITDNYGPPGYGGVCLGGGVCVVDGSPAFFSCRIVDNVAGCAGGAISILHGSLLMEDCEISENRTLGPDCTGSGGGIFAFGTGNEIRLLRCILRNNRASGDNGGNGGAISSSGSIDLVQCIIDGNRAVGDPYYGDSHGGGISSSGSISLRSTIVINNSADIGAGIRHHTGDAFLDQCTFVANRASLTGGGGYFSTSTPISNSIFWENEPDQVVGNADMRFCNIQGGYPGEGNIDEYPHFVDPRADHRLAGESPCIDGGDPARLDACRPSGLGGWRADMGAYGGEQDCGWPVDCVDLALVAPSRPLPLFPYYTSNGAIWLWNCTFSPIDFNVEEQSDWLVMSPTFASLPADSLLELELSYDATQLNPGTHRDTVSILHTGSGELLVPVELEVLSPFDCSLIDPPPAGYPGESLQWVLQIQNLDIKERTAELWADAFMPNGAPFPGNPVIGPDLITIAADTTKLCTLSTLLPALTPIQDDYRLCTLLGPSPVAWNNTCFDFVVHTDPIIHVPAEQPTIRDAIAYAADGEQVVVAIGTYRERNLDFQGKAITVRSTDPMNPEVVLGTVIDGDGTGPIFEFRSGEGLDATLAGLSMTGSGGFKEAIQCRYSSSPTIDRCRIVENEGGGIYCTGSALLVRNSLIHRNEHSGGISCSHSSARIEGCTITANSGWRYAGVGSHYGSTTILADCFIADNTTDYEGGGVGGDSTTVVISDCVISNNSAGWGGGIHLQYKSDLTMTGCTIANNVSDKGGGIHLWARTTATLRNCVIENNITTAGEGGGILCESTSSPLILDNCILANNTTQHHGGGIRLDRGSPDITNCTFTGNRAEAGTGAAIYCGNADPILKNCILWGNQPGEIIGGSPVVSYSNVAGGFVGEGNFDTDPLLLSVVGFEHMPNPADRWIDGVFVPRSPCIDAGDPTVEDRVSDWHPWWPDWVPNSPRSDVGAYGGAYNAAWWPRRFADR